MPRILSAFIAATLLAVFAHAEETPPILERIEWNDLWVVNANASDRPKVLLVGDSIVKGYYAGVEKELGEKADLSRFATSLFLGNPDYLTELRTLLRRYTFEVIHINNGLHGFGYTEEQYRQGIADLLALLKTEAPHARIVWCTTTPMRDSGDLSKFKEDNPRVIERNKIALEALGQHGIPVDDLYTLVADHPEYYAQDGVHFSEAGRAAQAKQVAETILPLLAQAEEQPK